MDEEDGDHQEDHEGAVQLGDHVVPGNDQPPPHNWTAP